MIKYFPIFLFLCFSCASSKTLENKPPQSTANDSEIIVDDSEEIPAPDIDLSAVHEEKEDSDIVEFPDKEASFPGCAEKMKKWISENLKYPKTATETNTEGKVYVEFNVLKDGSIEDISIMRGVSKEINIEAKRLVKTMPKWIPGENKGEAVNVRCRIPILFELK